MTENSPNDSVPPTAVVTGASGTLGQQICDRFRRNGFVVIRADTVSKSGDTLLAPRHDSSGWSYPLDVAQPDQWKTLRNFVDVEFSQLDCLVNCAGKLAFGEAGTTHWQDDIQVLNVNLHGTILGCTTMLDLLRKSPRGHLINIASYSGFAALPWATVYSASKAGVIAYTESLALSLIHI